MPMSFSGKIMGMRLWIPTVLLSVALTVAGSGCAKNVDRIEFEKWGNSFVNPQRNTTGMDLTAQGGAAQNGQIPQNDSYKVPRASVGGSYHRNFASSPNYRLVGGFHVSSQ